MASCFLSGLLPDGCENFSELSRIKAQKIAYVPGGLYPLSGIVALWRVQKVKTVLPYFLERIIPHSILSRKLQVQDLIALFVNLR